MGSKDATPRGEKAEDQRGVTGQDGALGPPLSGGEGEGLESQGSGMRLSDIGVADRWQGEGNSLQDGTPAVGGRAPDHDSGAADPVPADGASTTVKGELKQLGQRISDNVEPRRTRCN